MAALAVMHRALRLGKAEGKEVIALALSLDGRARREAQEALDLAESLGLEIVHLPLAGNPRDVAAAARHARADTLVIGEMERALPHRVLSPMLADSRSQAFQGLERHIVRISPPSRSGMSERMQPYALALAMSAMLVAVTFLTRQVLVDSAMAMIYLLATAFVAARSTAVPAFLSSILNTFLFLLFAVEPYAALQVPDQGKLLTVALMVVIGLIISTLSIQLREKVAEASDRELATNALLALSRGMNEARSATEAAELACATMERSFPAQASIFVLDKDYQPLRLAGLSPGEAEPDHEALREAANGNAAGQGLSVGAAAEALYWPVSDPERVVAVIALKPEYPGAITRRTRESLEGIAGVLFSTIQRLELTEHAQQKELQAETEKVKNILLRSVSHDLRTPLTTISGTASVLYADESGDTEKHKDLAKTILDETWRLTNMITNLLNLTRLESGAVKPNPMPEHVDDIVGSSLQAMKERLKGRKVNIDLPDDLPPVNADAVLLGQAVNNLLENALRYTGKGKPIDISATARNGSVQIIIGDHGPGLPEGEETQIFELYVRGKKGKKKEGTGLGLAICRAIAELHNGDIHARNRPERGAEFVLTVPAADDAPLVPLEEEFTHEDQSPGS